MTTETTAAAHRNTVEQFAGVPKRDNDYAYQMGRDCVEHGPNDTNCHFSIFATPELMRRWEDGKRDATQPNK